MWQIRVGAETQPDIYLTTNEAAQTFMRAEMAKPEGGDAIKEHGVYLVSAGIETFDSAAAYKLCYPDTGDSMRDHIATCGGSVVLRWDAEMIVAIVAEAKENLVMFHWLNKRSRWASVDSNFVKGGTYENHQVVFYDAKIGWVHAKPGNGYKEAVWNAMNMRFNYETGEYFNPPN